MNEESIKIAFSKVKEDISALNKRLDALEALIKDISTNNNQNPLVSTEFKGLKPSNGQILKSSSGNEGVQSINHSTINQSFNNQADNQSENEGYKPQIREDYDDKSPPNHSLSNHSLSNQSQNMHSLSIQSLKKELESRFNSLTNQEFLVFLTIYQLEEDLGRFVTYSDLSQKLSLTSGCIRGYVSSIIRKNLPVIKSKINNRTLTLGINPEFKDLNLKERLTNLYYNQDPDQTKLF